MAPGLPEAHLPSSAALVTPAALILSLALGREPSPTPKPPPPVDCPPGTVLRGGAPPEDSEAWCEGRPDAFGNPRRHGPWRTWYDDGTLWIEAQWSEGRRDGPFVEYHRNGKRARQGTYRLDGKVGTWSIWFESGQPEEQAGWTDNLPDGHFTTWHRNGQKRSEGRYCMGAQCGPWITWDENGRELGRMTYEERRAAP